MVSAGLKDPSPSGLAKIKGKLSSALPTELLGGLLKKAPNLRILQSSYTSEAAEGPKIRGGGALLIACLFVLLFSLLIRPLASGAPAYLQV